MPHIHELIDLTVAIYIVHQHKVLFIHHKELSQWLPVGGHVELNEDPEQAALREAYEESGLKVKLLGAKHHFSDPGVKALTAPKFLDIHQINERHRHIGMIYFATTDTDQVVLEKDKHHDIRWLTLEDLRNPQYQLRESVRYYAEWALQASSG